MSSDVVPDYRLASLLKRAQHSMRTRIDDALRPLKLTAPQFAVLNAVDVDPGLSNAELARLAFVTAPTMQGILTNLERDGLLARTPHPQHGRILRSELTDRGREVLQRARQQVGEVERLLADALGQEDAARFADMLARCTDRLAVK